MSARKKREFRVWVGQYRWGRRTVYAKTIATTRAECLRLIDEGPFYNTEPVRAALVLDPPSPAEGEGEEAMSKPEPKLEPLADKSCPWCQSADIAVPIIRHTCAVCQNCGARGPVVERSSQAIAAWNTRTPASEPTEAQVEAAAQAMYTSWAHRTYGKSSVDDPRWEKQWPQQDATTRAMWCADARAALEPMADTTLAKALALIEAHRKVTPEPPGVRYVAVTFECDDDAPRAYIRSVINDAPVVAQALVEAVELLQRLTTLPPREGVDLRAFMASIVSAKDAARDWLAKHGDGG